MASRNIICINTIPHSEKREKLLTSINKLYLKDHRIHDDITPLEFYRHLQKQNLLKYALGLDDLKILQKCGSEFFKENFSDAIKKRRVLYAWRSTSTDINDNLFVPFIVLWWLAIDTLIIDWMPCVDRCNNDHHMERCCCLSDGCSPFFTDYTRIGFFWRYIRR